MAIDSRQKRASAFYLLLPVTHGAQSDTSGVDDEERWATTWMYSGIAIGDLVIALPKGWITQGDASSTFVTQGDADGTWVAKKAADGSSWVKQTDSSFS